jgi:hypothetical protein
MNNDDSPDDLDPAGDQELSPSGQPIYRHKARKKPFELAHGDSETIEAVEKHIAEHLGEADSVFHEIMSDLVHIDVHVVKPSAKRPYYSLVTSGMSDRPMTTPEGAHDLRFAELMINLPADWPIEGKDGQVNGDPAAYWPIGWLKMIARLPHEYTTWLAFGHTIPNGDPAEPFEGTDFIGSILLPPMLAPDGFSQLTLPGRTVHFYALCPLYAEEMQLKLEGGTDALLEAFDKADLGPNDVEIVTPGRRNAAG